MKSLQKAFFGLITLVLAVFAVTPAAYAATSPSLGTAASFSVLAKTAVSNVPTSVISRDVGLSPAPGTGITGLTPAQVGGIIYAADSSGPAGAAGSNSGLLTTAVNDMTSVFNNTDATGIDQPCTNDYSGTGNKDLTTVSPLGPGVYCADSFSISGNLTLSGSGVWIFKSAATLTTAASSTVTGGDPCNVWWRLASAGSDLGTSSTMIGNILALTSINMNTGATLNGRALARAAVTLHQNTITGPTCAAAVSGSSTGTGSGSGPKTPGLPNTGLAARHSDNSWFVVSTLLVGTAMVTFVFLKKYSSVG